MILICYDGSADAGEAIVRGAAVLRGQRATVLTVWSPFDSAALGPSGGVEDMQNSDEAGRRHAQEQAEVGARLAAEAGFDASPRAVGRRTTIADAILDEADGLEAAAILVGSRGVDGIKSMVLGSVSHAVIQHADRMVIVVPSPEVASARARDRPPEG
ncbi:MAG TPA: universal stress protein [Solirubrobacteraceae bacterium]|nr:universal stress protein [Solirubrobacteraceae bacterium]